MGSVLTRGTVQRNHWSLPGFHMLRGTSLCIQRMLFRTLTARLDASSGNAATRIKPPRIRIIATTSRDFMRSTIVQGRTNRKFFRASVRRLGIFGTYREQLSDQ